MVVLAFRCGETRDDIPLLPFSVSRILPAVQILISSLGVQNSPALLPPGSVCLLSICPDCRCLNQPLPGVSRKQRYNTLDFPTENRVPTGMLLAPIGNPEPRGYSLLDTLLFLAAMVSTLSKLGGFHAVKNVKSEKHFHHRVVVLRFSYMGYCLVFANSHVSAMAKAEGRTIFV